MTTYADTTQRAETRWPLFAALGTGLALVLTAIGTFWDVTGNDGPGADHTVGEYLIVAGIIAVAALLVFGLVVLGAERGNAARRSIVLAAVAVPSVLVFWTGLPPVLAAGALSCAVTARSQGSRPEALPLTAMALSGLVLVASVLLAITG